MASTTSTRRDDTGADADMIARLWETAAVDRVFGAPIEQDGATVVPVASVRAATARGGRGRRARRRPQKGDAVAVVARPAGVYIIRKGRVRWRPAVDVARLIVMGNLTAVAYFASVSLSAWARAMRSEAAPRRQRRRRAR